MPGLGRLQRSAQQVGSDKAEQSGDKRAQRSDRQPEQLP
jgi:hypothetical protein